MVERPILYSVPMVRALLDGRKTVTRRLLTPQPEPSDIIAAWRWFGRTFCGGWSLNGTPPDSMLKDCPYGQPGDWLWVREAWASLGAPKAGPYVYRADTDGERVRVDAPWRPSIHMHRAASRLTLEVVSVRAERLHDITEKDARAEGMQSYHGPLRWVRWLDVLTGEPIHNSARDAFASYFVTLPGGADAWARNDWVWRVETRRVEGAA